MKKIMSLFLFLLTTNFSYADGGYLDQELNAIFAGEYEHICVEDMDFQQLSEFFTEDNPSLAIDFPANVQIPLEFSVDIQGDFINVYTSPPVVVLNIRTAKPFSLRVVDGDPYFSDDKVNWIDIDEYLSGNLHAECSFENSRVRLSASGFINQKLQEL